MVFTIPPGTKTLGQSGFVADINSAYAALAALATGNVLDTAYGSGADPTGATDSTAAIQAALNSFTGSGVVVVPPGMYMTTAPLVIPSYVTLMSLTRGFGTAVDNYGVAGLPAAGAVLKPSSGFSGASVIAMNNTAGTTQMGDQVIRGITIDGSSLPAGTVHGVQSTGPVAAVTLDQVTVYKVTGNGFYAALNSGFQPADFWDVSRCRASDCGGWGWQSPGLSDSYFYGSEMTTNYLGGWDLHDVSNGRLVACKGEQSSAGPGFLIEFASVSGGYIILSACTSEFNQHEGFLCQGSAAGTIIIATGKSTGDGLGSTSAGYAGLRSHGCASLVSAPDFVTLTGTQGSATGPQYGIAQDSSGYGIAYSSSRAQGVTASLHDDGTCTVPLNSTAAGLVMPSGDATGAKDTAAALQAAAFGWTLAPGTFRVGNLPLPGGSDLGGSGAATVLSAVAGTTGAVISLASASATRQVSVHDLTVNCNSISGLNGVSLDNTGLSPSTPGFHRLDNLTVINCAQDSYYYAALQECFTTRCLSFGAGRYGFNVQNGATDSRWVSCTSGGSGSDGFYVSGSNCHYVACKAYYAGWTSGGGFTHGAGFHVDAISTYFSAGISFTGCEAQDCADNGWFYDPSGGPIHSLSMAACVIDSCNAAGNTGALACGISTNSLVNSSITGNSIFNRSGGAGTMSNPYAVAGVQTGLFFAGNSSGVTSSSVLYVSGYGYVSLESWGADLSGIPGVKLGSAVLGPAGAQAIATGNTISPNAAYGSYPLTVAAAATGVILGAGAYTGQRLVLMNTAAYGSGFSITFAAAATSHVADGTADVLAAGTAGAFTWSGTYWYRG